MRRTVVAWVLLLFVAPLNGCFLFSSDHDASPPQPLKNVLFRLGAPADSVELRLESDWFASHNWTVVAASDGKVGDADLVVTIRGVREPMEPAGSSAPASARLVLPRDPEAPAGKWPLVLVLQQKDQQQKDQAVVKDVYSVERVGSVWKVTPEQGSFSRFSAQGSN